jgi:hypothetical protein
MQNRRVHPRYGVRIEGKLMSPEMALCVDVVIRDLSEDGALINVLAPASIVPERVYLWQARTRTLFECKVQWRKSDRLLGLRFTEECSRLSVRDLLAAAAPAYVVAQQCLATPRMPMRCAS